jgi:FkbM family methyltransferase
MWRGWADRLHRALGRSRAAARLAVMVRNQTQCVIGWYLGGPTSAMEENGELLLMQVLGSRVRTFIDVGANVGHWTQALLKIVSSEARGFLYEPAPSTSQHLIKVFAGESRVVIRPVAVGSESGWANFYAESGHGETSSLVAGFSGQSSQTTTCQVVTLDEELAGKGWEKIDFLKLDCEGFDLKALLGVRRLLKEKSIGVIQFEYNRPWMEAGSTLAGAWAYLRENGYAIYLLQGDGLHSFQYEKWGEFFKYANFVAVHPDWENQVSSIKKGLI